VKTAESSEQKTCHEALSLGKRIRDNLQEFLTEFPAVTVHPHDAQIEAEVYHFSFQCLEIFYILFFHFA